MSDQPMSPNQPPPAVPPTEPFGPRPVQPVSKWPTVIGVIAIVYAAFTLVCGLAGMLMAGLMNFASDGSHPDLGPGEGWGTITGYVGWAASVLLLIAGIGLTMRRRWSVPLARIWSVIAIILGITSSIFTYLMVQHAAKSMATTTQPAPPAGVMEMMAAFTAVLTLLWHVALPLFLLIWFARKKIKTEIAGWR